MSDELSKALKENSKRLVSKGFGDGKYERGLFMLNKETHRLEAVEKVKPLDVNAPFVHQDTIPATMSMTGTDNIYESRSALRREYKEMGFVEVGEVLRAKPMDREKRYREIRETVEKSIHDIKNGNAPIDEKSREVNLREEREWKEYKNRMER